jgi:UDP-N-acetylmuramoyl-tripeptide--D-alanyl-D-alanine ligase
MLELGADSLDFHKAVVKQLREEYGFDKVFLCGKDFSAAACNPAAAKDFSCFANVGELGRYFSHNTLKGYNILLKGSRGIHLEKIIESL